MGLLDYVFRRVAAYEAIKTVNSLESSGKSSRRRNTGEKEYRAMLRLHGPAIAAAFRAIGTADLKVLLPVLRKPCEGFLADLDANPAPPRFAHADVEYRLAMSLVLDAIDMHLEQFSPGQMEVAGWEYVFADQLKECRAHLERGNALMGG